MQLQFIGCGDAFGSGGRFNTCFHVTGERANFLIDCGASSLPSLKRHGVARNDIDLVKACERKIAKSALKYPVEKARGNNRKYDQL